MFNVPEQAAFQVRVVDANDPIEVYAETVFMAMPGCEGMPGTSRFLIFHSMAMHLG